MGAIAVLVLLFMAGCFGEMENRNGMDATGSDLEFELRQAEQSGDQHRTSELRREAIERRRAVSEEQVLFEIYEKEAQFLFDQNRPEDALALIQEHLTNDNLSRYPERYLNALIIQTNVYIQKNMLAEQLQSSERIMEVVDQVENKARRAAGYATRAVVMARVNPTSSVRLYYQALNEFISVNDRGNEAVARNNLGLILHDMQDFEAAINEYEQAMEINQDLDNRVELARNYNNMANALSKLGHIEQTLDYMQRSLELNRKLNRQTSVVQNYFNLGNMHAEKGALEEAFFYFDQGYSQSGQMQFAPGLMYHAMGLGEWHFEQGNFEQSLRFLNESAEIARSLSQKGVLANTYNIASRVYEAKGSYRQALTFHQNARELSDSLSVQLRNREIEEIRASYDFDIQASENERLTEQLLYQERIAQVQWLILILLLLTGVIGIVSVVLISRKQKKLTAAYRTLEKNNLEITRKNSQLQSLNKELILLHEEKNKLVDIMVHDLRNPLASVIGFLDIATDEDNKEDHKMYLSMALEGSQRLRSLIDSLLQVHTLQTSADDTQVEWSDVSSLVTKCVKNYESVAQSKQITLVTQTEPLQVESSPSHVTRILDNLVSNAIKFSPPNTTIVVKAARHAEKSWVLSVQDQGPGLSEDDMQKAFTMFGRLSARPTGGEESLGLGLFAVKILVEKLKGTVTVHNNAQGGACFQCIFPESAGISDTHTGNSGEYTSSTLNKIDQ